MIHTKLRYQSVLYHTHRESQSHVIMTGDETHDCVLFSAWLLHKFLLFRTHKITPQVRMTYDRHKVAIIQMTIPLPGRSLLNDSHQEIGL